MLDREGGKGRNKMVIGFSKHNINMNLSVRIFLRFQRDPTKGKKNKIRAAPNAADFRVQKPSTTPRKF